MILKRGKRIESFLNSELSVIIFYIIKWILIALVIGAFSGSASALFLAFLDWATVWREDHLWIISLLPIGGLLIGLMYHYFGREVEAGNNLILDQVHNPGKVIPFKMAPLILLGTVVTHFFGGSAGREGTAVQMGGSIADQLNHLVKLSSKDRMIILICGISGGFASVFGTPLAGFIFGLEVYLIGRLRYTALFPAIITALVADLVCDAWGIHHTVYRIDDIPPINFTNTLLTILAGVAFGLSAKVFANLTHYISGLFKKGFSYPPFRPAVGGIIVASGVWLLGTTKYIGLGIPVILESFSVQLLPYDFALKIIFTAVTLGAAFKGGEVTPLFFIGATLGNALSLIIPLPMALMAGIGFVAVFAGAANTPLSTTFMAIELFGMEVGMYAGIASVTAYLVSGHSGIYASQKIGEAKHHQFHKEKGGKISSIKDIRNDM